MDREDNEKNRWKLGFNPLHLEYWIFILVLVIIAIFSYHHSGDTNLGGLIAFAASISSIILSVLAIFITILSNNSVGGMLHKVRDMHDTILSIPESIKESIADLKEATTELMAVNSEVNRSVNMLGGRLDDLENHLSLNDNKIDTILNSVSSVNSTGSSNTVPPTEKMIEQFLNTISLNGLYLLYAFILYSERRKSGVFFLDQFAKNLFGVESSYLLGILVATSSVNIISYVNVEETHNMGIKNMFISPFIKKDILFGRITVLCNDIVKSYETMRNEYDAKSIEKTISDYIDTID